MLHGASTWAMTKAMAEDLDVARRQILTYILRIFRRKPCRIPKTQSWSHWQPTHSVRQELSRTSNHFLELSLRPCKLGCANGLLLESWLGELTADGHKLFWIGTLKVYVALADHSQDDLTTLLCTQAQTGETLRWMPRNGIIIAAALCHALHVNQFFVLAMLPYALKW